MEVVIFGTEPQSVQNPGDRKSPERQLRGKKLVTVFLHGFPAVRSKQNREIAEIVARETGRPVELLLYSGLGFAAGVFSFRKTLHEVGEYFDGLFASGRAEKVDLVGHSWGGFLALVLASRNPARVRRVVLMSPLLKFAGESDAARGFDGVARDNPVLRLGNTSELAADFAEVGKSHPTEELIRRLPASVEVLFLQAKEDELTPLAYAEAARAFFAKKPHFEIADNNHSFLRDRPALAKKIAAFLSDHGKA